MIEALVFKLFGPGWGSYLETAAGPHQAYRTHLFVLLAEERHLDDVGTDSI